MTSSAIRPSLRSATMAQRSASSSSRRARWYCSERSSIAPSSPSSKRARKRPLPELVRAAQTLGGVGANGAVLDQLVEPRDRGLGRVDARLRLLLHVEPVVLEPERADHERHRETLEDERREHDAEGEEDDQVAPRERRARVGRERDRQRRGKRDGAAHARPADEGRLLPRRIRIAPRGCSGTGAAAGTSAGWPRRCASRSRRPTRRPRSRSAATSSSPTGGRGSAAAAGRRARRAARS